MLLDTYVVCVSSQTLPVILYYIIILQPVTEDEVSPKKKRVLVKKHRKITTEESLRGGDRENKSRDDEYPNIVDKEIARPRGDTHGTEEMIQRDDISNDDDDNDDGESWWMEDTNNDKITSNKNDNDHDEKKRPMVVYISDSMNHHIASYEYRDTNEDNDNVSTLDGEDDENKTESSGDDDNIYSEGIAHTAGEENHSCPDNDKGGDKSNEDSNKDVTSSTISSKSCPAVSLSPKLPLQLSPRDVHDAALGIHPVEGIAAAFDESNISLPPLISLTVGRSSPTPHLSSRISLPQLSIDINDANAVQSFGIANMPKLRDDEDSNDNDDDDKDDDKAKSIHVGGNSIFRDSTDVDEKDSTMPSIHDCGSGSSVTEVTSNIDGLLKPVGSSFDDTLEPLPASVFRPHQSGLDQPVSLKKVESYKSTDRSLSSNVSYFSYEDVSIASEECEMCAICLCPYEEGDIRMFSKRCTHVFHRLCVLEWLVKAHHECPCCRVEMVTKAEIKDVSQSLIGTDRLAQAMAVVGSDMQQAPPFRVRGSVQGSRLYRQMISRTRAQRRSEGSTGQGQSAPQSPNPNPWLWSARFADSPSTPTTPTRNNSSSLEYHQIGPSLSSDAVLMNSHETVITTATPPTGREGRASIHNTRVGYLFSSDDTMIHSHWHQRPRSIRSNSQTTVTLSPSRVHTHWQQRQRR